MKAKPNKKFVDGQKYYGIHACLALWDLRPQDVIRVYVHESNVPTFGALLKGCARDKKAYHIVSSEELNRITDSVHHEGICIVAKGAHGVSFEEMVTLLQRQKECLLYLDGVQNPHNIGSILRTCAHFGIRYVIGDQLPPLSASACRIAKGGAERVQLIRLNDPVKSLHQLKKLGFVLVGTSSHKGSSLYDYRFSERTILVFGAEADGMGRLLQKLVDHHVQIPGTGWVESLNVAVATSLCLGEYVRQQRPAWDFS